MVCINNKGKGDMALLRGTRVSERIMLDGQVHCYVMLCICIVLCCIIYIYICYVS